MNSVPSAPLRVGFVMEQVLGHVTVAQNLSRAMAGIVGVEARWVETPLYRQGGGVERIPLLPSYVRGGLRGLIDTVKGIGGEGCDVLVFNTQKAAIFAQHLMITTPTILMTDVTPTQYDRLAAPYAHTVDGSRPVTAAKHWANVLNFRLARAVVGYSRWTADSFERDYGVPSRRVHVIPPGIDTLRFRPRTAQRSAGPLRILFVGGDFERKGGKTLINVFRQLGLGSRAELHIVTRDAVAQAPGIVVHRDVPNNSERLLEIYRSSDVFVLPTLADCFSNASIEAMACGLPVITTPVGGIPDIVVDGDCGFLVPPGDEVALAAALRRVIDDGELRAALGDRARRRAVSHFDARANAIRLIELARAVSRPHKRRRLAAPARSA
jgi:glycosyltransferase involved in cell wall biosynthesis